MIRGRLELHEFRVGYVRFAEQCARIGFIRYEDFVRSPEATMKRLCSSLKIGYDGEFTGKWSGYNRVTGDRPNARNSARIGLQLRNHVEPGLLRAFGRDPNYGRALDLLGYHHRASTALHVRGWPR